MRIARWLWLAFSLLVVATGIQWLYVTSREAPENLPWTPLDLHAPIGRFTGMKLARLGDETGQCRALLRDSAIAFTPVPDREGETCGYIGAIRLKPATPVLACPLGAAFDLWERQIVRPAAEELFGSKLTGIEDFGSYSCRRMYGRAQGNWSQHAFANAVDVAGFRLADGTRITVARDWGKGEKGRFLARVRDGACRLFGTTLSPDYNAAHRDHLHLDMTDRGGFGWGVCR